jgi:aspartyl/asparaginyl beta-hydroxylase (cupin superfamily)
MDGWSSARRFGLCTGEENMAMSGDGEKTAWARRRRKYVKRCGRRLTRVLDRYLARQSLVPDAPILDASHFPWIAALEAHWQTVLAEVRALLRHREHLPFFQDISRDQKRISPDDKWRTFFLYGFGNRLDRNCRLCPETARMLEQVPGVETAFFSILAPGKVIPEHRGITKGLIRCHLGIIVPPTPDRCFMDVGDVRCSWQEGRVLMFDDSYPHAVANHSDQERVVLLFDVPRPLSLPGRVVRSALLWGFRRTAYVQDAMRNEARWEERRMPMLASAGDAPSASEAGSYERMSQG